MRHRILKIFRIWSENLRTNKTQKTTQIKTETSNQYFQISIKS